MFFTQSIIICFKGNFGGDFFTTLMISDLLEDNGVFVKNVILFRMVLYFASSLDP